MPLVREVEQDLQYKCYSDWQLINKMLYIRIQREKREIGIFKSVTEYLGLQFDFQTRGNIDLQTIYNPQWVGAKQNWKEIPFRTITIICYLSVSSVYTFFNIFHNLDLFKTKILQHIASCK